MARKILTMSVVTSAISNQIVTTLPHIIAHIALLDEIRLSRNYCPYFESGSHSA